MIVRLATANPVKVRAVKAALRKLFPGARLVTAEAESGVSPQPLSLGETIRGARNRARRCRGRGTLGMGVESGLFRLEGRTLGVTICAVTDGRRTTLGGGPFFELPGEAVRILVKGEVELGVALARKYGIPNPARDGGAVGVLSRGAVGRADLVRYAALMALFPWIGARKGLSSRR